MNRFFAMIIACVMSVSLMAKRTATEPGVYSGTVTIQGTAYTNDPIYLFPGTEPGTLTCVAGKHVWVNIPQSEIVLSAKASTANYAITNGGFEGSWSNNEPNGWHSFGTAAGNLANFVSSHTDQFTQSTDKRPGSTGSHSALLQTSVVFGVVANGNCTNGRINAGAMKAADASGNYNFSDPSNSGYITPFVGNPDSLVFWAKYIPADGKPSNSNNKARMHTVITTNARYQDPEASDYSSVKIAEATSNYSATTTMGWQRISVPFVYSSLSPDQAAYMLITFTTNQTPGGGSASSGSPDKVFLDDVQMVYNYGLKTASLDGHKLTFTNDQATIGLPFSEEYEWKISTNGKAAQTFVGYDAQNYRAYIYVAAHNYAQEHNYHVYTVQMDEGIPVIPTTFYDYTASTCADTPYSDSMFTDLTESGEYTDTLINMYGGDSIVTLTLKVYPTYRFEEEIYIHKGDTSWRGQFIPEPEPADEPYLFYDSLQTVEGCDSIYVLRLYVSAIPRTYGKYNARFCEGDSVEYEGVWYSDAFEGDILLAQKNCYGGDSVVNLTVQALPNYLIEEQMTIIQGTDTSWSGIPLSTWAPGVKTLRVPHKSIDDCDSICVLRLTILATATPIEGADTVNYSEVYGRFDGELMIGDERQGSHSVYLLPGAKDSTVTFVMPNFSYNGGGLGHIVLPNITMNTYGQLLLERRTLYLDSISERATITMLNGDKVGGKTYYSIVTPAQAQIVLYIQAPSLPEGIKVFFYGAAVKDKNYDLENGGFEGAWTDNEPQGWHSFGSATGKMAAFITSNTHQFVPSDQVRPASAGKQSALISATSLLSVVANGNCTNGQINGGSSTAGDASKNFNFSDPENTGFNTPFHGRPDSLIFWAKYNGEDAARVSAIITTDARYQDPEEAPVYGDIKIGAAALNYNATADKGWQRISVPFVYYAQTRSAQPAYILTTFTTNKIPGGGALTDSVYLDDAQVVFNKSLLRMYVGSEVLTFVDHVAHVSGNYCDDCDTYIALADGESATPFVAFDAEHRCVYVYVLADDYTANKTYNIYRIEFDDSSTDDLKPIEEQTEGMETVTNNKTNYRKLLINGQIYILDGQAIYDIFGRKIK